MSPKPSIDKKFTSNLEVLTYQYDKILMINCKLQFVINRLNLRIKKISNFINVGPIGTTFV